jgi:hypothetical protein
MTAPSSIDPARFLHEQLESASPDLLRDLMSTFIDVLMSADAEAACGAPYGTSSPERTNVRNGYRHRDFDTRVGTLDVAIPTLRQGSYLPDWEADDTGQIIAAWIAKEELRALLATAARGGNRSDIAHHKHRFHTWCATVDIPEVTTLAETIQTWWPEIEAFCRTRITNAGTEGTNRLIKEVGRRACGFRNPENHRRRVRFYCTRQSRRNPVLEGQLPPQS